MGAGTLADQVGRVRRLHISIEFDSLNELLIILLFENKIERVIS